MPSPVFVVDEPDFIRVPKLAQLVALAGSGGGGGGGSGVSSFNTRTGAVTLSSSDVTSALGYTPLRPSNNLSDVGSIAVSRSNLGLVAIAASGSGADLTANSVTLGKLATQADQTVLGNVSGGAAAPVALTATQATALLNTFTSSLKGLAPASGGGTTNFLRADGTWAVPPSSGGGTWGSITGTLSSQTDLQAALDARLTVVDNSVSWHPTSVRYSPVPASITLGDERIQGTTTIFPEGFEFDLSTGVGLGGTIGGAPSPGGCYFNVILNARNRVPFGVYGTVLGWEFNADPYVNTNVIYHAGNLVLSGDVTNSGLAITIANSAVTLAKMANVATATVFYRKTAGTGAPEVQTLATLKSDLGLTGTNSGDQTITLTGDVTGSGTGSFATAVGANKITRSMLAATAGATILGATAAGNVADLTAAQAKTFLAISSSDVSGLAAVATSGSAADLGSGTLPAGRMPALTGDVTTSAGAVATAIGANKVLDTMIRQSAGLSIIGRSANTTGNVADITGAANGVLRVSGTTLAFGAVDLATAMVTGRLPYANVVAPTTSSLLLGRGTTTGDWQEVTLGATLSFTTTALGVVKVPNAVTFDITGGAAAGSTFDGSAAKTVDYSTVGAQPNAAPYPGGIVSLRR
jgi:hypothetical protein